MIDELDVQYLSRDVTQGDLIRLFDVIEYSSNWKRYEVVWFGIIGIIVYLN